jgi:hypothetical protein
MVHQVQSCVNSSRLLLYPTGTLNCAHR